jgi:hypothetical protein
MRIAMIALAVLAFAGPACAQALSRDDLLEALRQRDAAIAALTRRVEALEAERTNAPVATAPASVPPVQASAAGQPPSAAAEPGPGPDEVALQALSRSLVQRGGLVLPAGRFEVIPGLAFAHSQVQGLVLADTPEGISTVTDQRRRDDSVTATLAVRVGLPWNSQFEVRAPVSWMRRANALGDATHSTKQAGGIGDIELELSHQFWREDGWRPDLVGAISWRAPTGRDPFRLGTPAIATGTGAHQIGFRLTAVKSADPMVFFSTLSYGANIARRESFGRVSIGNVIDWQLGAVLAVSPDTSISGALVQDFRARTRVDGRAIPGSDGLASVVQFGVDQVLASNVLLDVSLGIGLTNDAPDYSFRMSLPIRF